MCALAFAIVVGTPPVNVRVAEATIYRPPRVEVHVKVS